MKGVLMSMKTFFLNTMFIRCWKKMLSIIMTSGLSQLPVT